MALLVRAQTAKCAVNLVLGMLADAARVKEDDIGLGGLVDQLITLPAQAAHDELAIQHVHLAADGFDVEFLGHVCTILIEWARDMSAHFGAQPVAWLGPMAAQKLLSGHRALPGRLKLQNLHLASRCGGDN